MALLTFIDGFGTYRNSYRKLIAIYIKLAGLTHRECQRRTSVMPLTLGPHGSNFADVRWSARATGIFSASGDIAQRQREDTVAPGYQD